MLVWQRVPNPSWVEALAQIAPRSDRLPWLHIFWEPGETWDPVQRWMIREMDPCLDYCDVEMLADYGVHPRSAGRGRWIGAGTASDPRRWKSYGGPSIRQYELFQQFRCLSHRVWVVQGPDGGHPFELSHAERMFKRSLGMSDADTPAPGALPYADPDRRTWRRLGALDRLRKWSERLTWDERRETKSAAGLWVARDLTAEYTRLGREMLNFFSEGIKESIDAVPAGTLQALYDAAPKTDAPAHDEDEIERRFVEAAPVTLDQAR